MNPISTTFAGILVECNDTGVNLGDSRLILSYVQWDELIEVVARLRELVDPVTMKRMEEEARRQASEDNMRSMGR